MGGEKGMGGGGGIGSSEVGEFDCFLQSIISSVPGDPTAQTSSRATQQADVAAHMSPRSKAPPFGRFPSRPSPILLPRLVKHSSVVFGLRPLALCLGLAAAELNRGHAPSPRHNGQVSSPNPSAVAPSSTHDLHRRPACNRDPDRAGSPRARIQSSSLTMSRTRRTQF